MERETMERIRRLARLSGGEPEEFAAILAYVDRLREVDVAGVPPFETAPEAALRPDEPAAGLDRDAVLEAAPDRAGDHLRVKRVLPRGR